jgi:ribonuclease P protein component
VDGTLFQDDAQRDAFGCLLKLASITFLCHLFERLKRLGFKSGEAVSLGICVLKKRRQFLAVSVSGGKKWVAPTFVLQKGQAAPSDKVPSFGFVVTRKMGKAVVRNRMRRRFKEAIRWLLKEGFHVQLGHYVCIARGKVGEVDFSALLDQLRRAFAFLRNASKRPKEAVPPLG